MMRFFARPSIALTSIAACVVGLTACSSDAADEVVSNPDQASAVTSLDAGQPASRALSDLIVDGSLTPEGFEYIPPTASGEPSMAELIKELSDDPEGSSDDLPGLIGGQSIAEMTTTTPTQCTGVAMDSLSVIDWMMLPTDTHATAGYGNLADEDDAIMITLTSDPVDPAHYPAELSECAEFTRTMDESGTVAASAFTAVPSQVSMDNAEVLVSADVTLTGATLNDQPVEGEGVGTTITVVTATTGGITFTVVAPQTADAGLITSIAAAQADRINNAPAA
ncbi:MULTISPECIES: hypothetical protein [Corynebacterium]|jgi:hypothetical protein|uniref:hypothetical protein n=1 Tax=Corynebacterium TaxID=1716 RepID=UPI00102FB2BD|nr:hypothetical protein [Corynebacterium neomassiliense]MCI1255867.1 hypothetical protein [Corynebacterium provencense]